jgi:hypothetical protein
MPGGLRESPAISVLIIRKLQHTQIGSVPVVLSVSFPHEKCPCLLDMDFLLKEITNPTLNFTGRK